MTQLRKRERLKHNIYNSVKSFTTLLILGIVQCIYVSFILFSLCHAYLRKYCGIVTHVFAFQMGTQAGIDWIR